jgi:hypothetical protein
MGMMQVAIDEVIDVVPVGDGLVTATRTVVVRPLVRAARVRRRAGACVAATDADAVFLNAAAIGMMQVPVVQIVDVAFVKHRGMTAIRAVLMRMVGVRMVGHGQSPFFEKHCPRNLVRLWVDFFLDRGVLLRRVLERVRDEFDDVAIGE